MRQIQGVYRVKSYDLAPLYQKARQMIARLDAFSAEHIPRELNREADRLANLAMDRGASAGASGPQSASAAKPKSSAPRDFPTRVRATYRQGILKLQQELPLEEGEEVEVAIIRDSR